MSTAQRMLLLLGSRVTTPHNLAIPTQTNLKEWLWAGAGTYQDNGLTTPALADGDPVGGWKDQSGAGKDVLQGTTANKPVLRLGANGIGNRAALSHDGSNDYVASAAFAAQLNQPNTIYVVFKPASNLSSAQLYDGIAGIPARSVSFIDGTTPNKYSFYAGTVVSEAGTTANTNAHVDCCIFNGASSVRYVDNTQKIAGNVGTGFLTGIQIGMNVTFTPASAYAGLIAELLIYNVAHDAATRQLIQNWLGAYYGIAMN